MANSRAQQAAIAISMKKAGKKPKKKMSNSGEPGPIDGIKKFIKGKFEKYSPKFNFKKLNRLENKIENNKPMTSGQTKYVDSYIDDQIIRGLSNRDIENDQTNTNTKIKSKQLKIPKVKIKSKVGGSIKNTKKK